MYFRRHCYDKPHRCSGWAGPGWRETFYDTEPENWYQYDEEHKFPFETSALRRRHWWQRRHRCDNGRIWTLSLDDPWRNFRFGRCTTCDIRTFPLITKWVDPSYLWYKVSGAMENSWWDLRNHKRNWLPPRPWWSLLHQMWKMFGAPMVRRRAWHIGFRAKNWWSDFQVWVNPQTRRENRESVMRDYGLIK